MLPVAGDLVQVNGLRPLGEALRRKGLRRPPGILRQLMENGMNVARFNFSHGTYETHKQYFDEICRVRDELGLPVTETGLALPCGATGRWFSE